MPTRRFPFQVRTSCDRLIVFIVSAVLFAFSGGLCRAAGRPSTFEAASSQIWASCRKDTRTSLVWA
jgi:hypothetical protein